jgi:hypothetical protein
VSRMNPGYCICDVIDELCVAASFSERTPWVRPGAAENKMNRSRMRRNPSGYLRAETGSRATWEAIGNPGWTKIFKLRQEYRYRNPVGELRHHYSALYQGNAQVRANEPGHHAKTLF